MTPETRAQTQPPSDQTMAVWGQEDLPVGLPGRQKLVLKLTDRSYTGPAARMGMFPAALSAPLLGYGQAGPWLRIRRNSVGKMGPKTP